MPELPEVEVTRRSIAGRLHGAHVTDARLGKPLRWPLGCRECDLLHRTVGEVGRRGKYLWLPMSARTGQPANETGGLLVHLGMSGSLSLTEHVEVPGSHDHFDLITDRGTLRLRDPRRFGAVVWSTGLQAEPAATLLGRLGAEPFDPALTPDTFHAALKRRRVAIKPLLLAGDIVVGAGNIYACEALFQAGIDPRVLACTISKPRAQRLLAAIRSTLAQALALGGSTLRDFRDAHGMDGAYQATALVYGREGQACTLCERPIKRIVQGQRSTFYCAHCQRR